MEAIMHQCVPITTGFVSTVWVEASRVVAILGVVAVSACGWKAGPHREIALTVAPVEGATIEPALRAALRHELTRALRDRGVVAGGRTVEITLTDVSHSPTASMDGTVAWTGQVSAEVRVPSRPACVLKIEGRRTWTLGPDAPADAATRRSKAISVLAVEAGQRAADALIREPQCR
jgi:hypothetical protein